LLILFALALVGLGAKPKAANAAETQIQRGERVVRYAKRFVGVPYRWGGMSPRTGFDCSGFTAYVYRHFGVSLPHYTVAQYQRGLDIRIRRLRPGDLLFFSGLRHVGMYVGHGRFIHSPRRGTRVRIDPLRGWYSGRLVGARRIVRWAS
jgi:cell wall-associated NlpC family hydrolase